MNNKNKELLGVGPAYPHTRTGGGKFPIAEGSDLIEMGLKQYVLTSVGRRMMEKSIGNTFGRLLFSLEGQQRDKALLEVAQDESPAFEPRATITNVTVTQNDNEIFVNMEYKNIEANVSGNAVAKVPTTSAGV
jgi:phage baseplate assembly protein W